MGDATIPEYRLELDKARLAHLYDLALDRRRIISELALLGLRNLLLLNGGAIVALFTVLGHVDQLTVDGGRLWTAFAAFACGVVSALVALLVAFLSSNASWLGEHAGAEFIYFHNIGEVQRSDEQNVAQLRAVARGNVLWMMAVTLAGLSLAAFAGGGGLALSAVAVGAKVKAAVSPVVAKSHSTPAKSGRGTHP